MNDLELIMSAAQQAMLKANDHQLVMDAYLRLKEALTPKEKK